MAEFSLLWKVYLHCDYGPDVEIKSTYTVTLAQMWKVYLHCDSGIDVESHCDYGPVQLAVESLLTL